MVIKELGYDNDFDKAYVLLTLRVDPCSNEYLCIFSVDREYSVVVLFVRTRCTPTVRHYSVLEESELNIVRKLLKKRKDELSYFDKLSDWDKDVVRFISTMQLVAYLFISTSGILILAEGIQFALPLGIAICFLLYLNHQQKLTYRKVKK